MTAKENTTTKDKATGRQRQDVERADGQEEREQPESGIEPEARAEARRLMERSRRLLQGTLEYRPITYSQADELTDKIIQQDDDVQAHAFITLLHGITAAYFERKQGGLKGPDVESIVHVAARRAYAKTSLFQDALRELVNLPPGTVEAMQDAKLRKEVWGGGGSEP